MRAEAALDDDVDPPCQCALQFLDQRQVVAEAAILRHVDQQIDIAVRPFFGAPDRAEQAQVRRAVPGGNGEELVAAAVEVVTQWHGYRPSVPSA